MAIIICAHAGAWNTSSKEHIKNELDSVEQAVKKGAKEKTPLLAAIEAVKNLENNPFIDAGIGSILQMDGVARTDAAVATNNKKYKKSYAGVLQLENIKNPCLVAKALLEYGYHSILSGESAYAFAKEENLEEANLIMSDRKNKFLNELEYFKLQEGELPQYKVLAKDEKALNVKKLSTVGAVAFDTETKVLVSVTSTGGLSFGYPGRVGDTGIFGHGIFCDNNVAVACTGEGDKMIQDMTASKVGHFYQQNNDIQKSVELAVESLTKNQSGESGIIAIDKKGNIGIAKSTTFLATYVMSSA